MFLEEELQLKANQEVSDAGDHLRGGGGRDAGSVRDFANAKPAAASTLVRDVSALLRMRLFCAPRGARAVPHRRP